MSTSPQLIPRETQLQFVRAAEWAAYKSRDADTRIGCAVFDLIETQDMEAENEEECDNEDMNVASDHVCNQSSTDTDTITTTTTAGSKTQQSERQVHCHILATACNDLTEGIEATPERCTRPDVGGNKYAWMVHAEAAALAQCAREGMKTAGAYMFCTAFPCSDCAKLIVQSGIASLFVRSLPSSTSAKDSTSATATATATVTATAIAKGNGTASGSSGAAGRWSASQEIAQVMLSSARIPVHIVDC